jgi:hypothetical protein
MALTLGLMFCVPGTSWLIILSRWRESAPLGVPANTASAEEEVLEGRIG